MFVIIRSISDNETKLKKTNKEKTKQKQKTKPKLGDLNKYN